LPEAGTGTSFVLETHGCCNFVPINLQNPINL
jgi:hypothetical protein